MFKNKLNYSYLFLFLLLTVNVSGQDKKWKEFIQVGGYVKYLPSVHFGGNQNLLTDNLIHNRLNFKAYFANNWTAKIEMRNRVFYGERYKTLHGYNTYLEYDPGLVDLTFLPLDKSAIAMQINFDRAYIEYAAEKWELTIGRQRINWGMNVSWNSNDLFNAYNLLDFDYQERPGADAVKFLYYLGAESSIEFAYKPAESLQESVLATHYKFNKWKYDFQFILANYYEDIALGLGWAGNLKDAGFKGETTFFHNYQNLVAASTNINALSLSTSIDYAFSSGFYLNAGFLFNSNGSGSITNMNAQLLTSTLSAKNLMPTKFSYFLQGSITPNPIINTGVMVIYGAGMDIVIFMPSLGYAIKENWDLSFLAQIFYLGQGSKVQNVGNSIFMTLEYSF